MKLGFHSGKAANYFVKVQISGQELFDWEYCIIVQSFLEFLQCVFIKFNFENDLWAMVAGKSEELHNTKYFFIINKSEFPCTD